MMRIPRTLILAAPLFLFASCSDDDPDLTDDGGDPERFEGLWSGEYSMAAAPAGPLAHGTPGLTGSSATGLALLDLTVEGHTATGEVVLHDLASLDTYPVLVAGEVDGSTLEIEAQNDAFYDEPVPFFGGQKVRLLWRDAVPRIPALDVAKHDAVAEEVISTELDKVLDQNKDIATALADARALIERRSRR